MKWTIVGTGWISKQFAEALLLCGEEIICICSRDLAKAKKFGDQFKVKNYITNINEDVYSESVYIGTPNITHYNLALECLKNKKNVMVEKPITHSFEKTKELFTLFEESNLKLMEGYIHINANMYICEEFTNSTLKTNFMQLSSKIKNNNYKNSSMFKKEMFGGVVSDLGVYPLSLAILLFGEVLKWETNNHKIFNGLVQDVEISLFHKNNNKTIFRISKLVDGNNEVYINNKLINTHITKTDYFNPMIGEINEFLIFDNYEKNKIISLHTNKIMCEIYDYLNLKGE